MDGVLNCYNNYSIQSFDEINLVKYDVDGHSSNIQGVNEDRSLFFKKIISKWMNISLIDYNIIKAYLYEDIFYKNLMHRLIFNLKALFIIIKLRKNLKKIFLYSSS